MFLNLLGFKLFSYLYYKRVVVARLATEETHDKKETKY